jgi:NADH pyrophosphatase NudC (nudix superfamily)
MSDDLIKRSDAIEALNECTDIKGFEYTQMHNALIDIPSADRPQGEWIDAEIPLECGGSMPIQVCNLCKTFYPLAYTGGGHRFCPNCGARMKGADDEV